MPITTRQATILDILAQKGIYPTFEDPRKPKDRFIFNCPLPGHRDTRPSFTVTEDGTQWTCWPCGHHLQGPWLLRELLEGSAPRDLRPAPVKKPPRPKKVEQTTFQGAELAPFLAAKGLLDQIEWVKTTLEWSDAYYGYKRQTRATRIPYFDQNGAKFRDRYRVGIDDPKDRFRWGPGPRYGPGQILYGLWNVKWVQQQGFVILVEGETDVATLLYHNYPVMGVPGASSWKHEWAAYFDGLQVFVWQEPETAGENLVAKLHQSFPDMLVMNAPEDAKDPNKLFEVCGSEFVNRINDLLDTSTAYEVPQVPPRFVDQDRSILFSVDEKVGFRAFYKHIDDDTLAKKRLFIASLPEVTEDQARRKQNIDHCFENYRTLLCVNTEELFIKRYKCNEAVCPFCAKGLLNQFLTMANPEGVSKMDLIEQYMDDPVIYEIYIGSIKYAEDRDTRVKEMIQMEKDILAWNVKLTDNYGQSYAFARDHIRGIRSKTEGDVVHYQLILMANRENEAKEILKKHFDKCTGINTKVNELECYGIKNAVNKFTGLMSVRCDWDTPENYETWRYVTKGSKLLQGKGIYYKVSGGKKPAKSENSPTDCPICGDCIPVATGGIHPVATTLVDKAISPITGRTYMVMRE